MFTLSLVQYVFLGFVLGGVFYFAPYVRLSTFKERLIARLICFAILAVSAAMQPNQPFATLTPEILSPLLMNLVALLFFIFLAGKDILYWLESKSQSSAAPTAQ